MAEPVSIPRDVLTPREAARFLRIRDSRVYEMLKDGTLIGRNLGTREMPHWRILRSEIERFLTSSVQVESGRTVRRKTGPKQFV